MIALGAITTGLTDAGLTLIGQREYVAAPDPLARRALASDIIGIRLCLTPVVAALLVLFCVVAGYPSSVVLGTGILGLSVVVANVTLGLTIPMAAELRFGAITLVEVVRQVAIVAGNVVVVVVAGSLPELFGIQLAAAACGCAVAATAVARGAVGLPVPNRERWSSLLREAAPMGLALVLGALYLRVLLVLTSLVAGPMQTGLFAASNRVIEVLVGIPAFVVGAAFPLMVRASVDDIGRLRGVLQTTLETTWFLASGLVILLLVAPGSVVEMLGGHAYAPAAGVLRLQALSLLGSYVSVVWTTALVVIRRQASLLVVNGAALVAVLAGGGALIALSGARGAALASAVGEFLIAVVAQWMLTRANRVLRPNPRFLAKNALGWLGAGLITLVPGLPAPVVAVMASITYGGVLALTRGLPAPVEGAVAIVLRNVGVLS